jgi:hypothetical protein
MRRRPERRWRSGRRKIKTRERIRGKIRRRRRKMRKKIKKMRLRRKQRFVVVDLGKRYLLIWSQIKALDKKKEEPKAEDGPRIFTLHK